MDEPGAGPEAMFRRKRARFATSLAVAAVTAGAAAAGGMGEPATPPTIPGPVADWSGPYVGLTFSGNFSDGEAERTRAVGTIIETDVRNGLFPDDIGDWQSAGAFGLTLGYNVQRASYVGGVEFSHSAIDQDIDFRFSEIDPEILVGVETISLYGTEIDNLSTLSLRAGHAFDRTFVYGKAGIARANVLNEYTLDLTGAAIPLLEFAEDDVRWGYTVGVGVERLVTDRISVLGEVSYFDLEDVTVEARAPGIFPGNELDYTFQNDGFMAKVGLNFAF